MKKTNIVGKIISIVFFVASIIMLLKVYDIYKTRDFNEFVRAEKNLYSSTFERDNKIKTNDKSSYKIKSEQFNDAMFFTTVKVEPQTPYKVTCMVKTENVENEVNNYGGGAQIAIEGTTERSKAIRGTNDWTQLVLYFDSKNRTEVNIGFRLGGYDNSSRGTAWFSDITCESGVENKSSVWNFACFIFKNLDVTLNDNGAPKKYNFSISPADIDLMKEDMLRFKNTCESFSQNRMKVNYDIIEIESPITSISYDTENAYYVNPTDVEKLIDKYIQNKNYDHIFAVVRMGDLSKNSQIAVNDWIGLGSMDYHNIGFANIRLPNSQSSYIYRYDYRINQFPEEVFVHEFLHSLERNLIENGYDIPALHDNEKYGYKNDSLLSLSAWYKDYMQKNINSAGNKIGLDPIVYTIKPVHESDFQYSYKMDIEKEPKNIIEEIRAIVKKAINIFSKVKEVGIENVKFN